MTQQKNAPPSPNPQDDIIVVGIGASAGGLDPLKAFFEAVPEETGMAFVVIVHLSPDHDSSMAELLQSHTSLEVMQVKEEVEIKQDHVYVIPPNKSLLVKNNHLKLAGGEKQKHRPEVIDRFFRSLGSEKGNKSVCVILSGTGSDGSLGIKTIKEYGGLAVVQEPDEAEYDGMPQNAIDTGLVDWILPVSEMPQELLEYRENKFRIKITDDQKGLSEEEQEVLEEIFTKIETETEHDFSRYKRATVLRRIERRMQVHSEQSLSGYLSILYDDPEEVQELFKDLLISVTNFFRNPKSFRILEDEVIPKLFKEKGPDDELRVWVPGCATGEEAYSMAILLHEYAQKVDHPPKIQVFATDVDERALQVARRRRYPEAIAADLSEKRLEQFFRKDGNEYLINEELRHMVLFTRHNLLQSPPFSNQDLISCRNLLIYLNKELQKQVFNLFHYALKADGLLFLGKSDSNLEAMEQFTPVSENHKIYQKRPANQPTHNLPNFAFQARKSHSTGSRFGEVSDDKPSLEHLHQRLMTNQYSPPSVIINERQEVMHATGYISQYLNYAGGEPSRNILKMVIPELQQDIRNLLYQAGQNGADLPVRKRVQLKKKDTPEVLDLIIHRIQEGDFPDDFKYIVFKETTGAVSSMGKPTEVRERASTEESEIINDLENELLQTKEQLQATVEDYETSNEELRSSNEELQSMNEELQATTEELQTSKEELQSVNEELKTINDELEIKVEELTRANSDLENLMEASEVAIVFVDQDNHLRRFTSKATDLFNLKSSDKGRPLDHFTHRLEYDALMDDVREVQHTQRRIQKEINDESGKAYIMRLRPYFTTEAESKGVVLSFVDVTELKATQTELTENLERVKKLQKELLKINVHERWKIGQYLHDELGQLLVVAKMKLGEIESGIQGDDKEAIEEIDNLKELLQQNIVNVRDLSHQIIPVNVGEEGLSHAFEDLAKLVKRTYDLNCELNGVEEMRAPVNVDVATHLYRIAHEATKNASIHGKAENIRISLHRDDQYLYLDIEDDGMGMAATTDEDESKEEGMGTSIMRHRMNLMGGSVSFGESDYYENTGTKISCRIPLKEAAA